MASASATGFSSAEGFSRWDGGQPSVFMLIVVWLFIGALIRSLPLCLQRILPYTVIVLLVGLGLGLVGAE